MPLQRAAGRCRTLLLLAACSAQLAAQELVKDIATNAGRVLDSYPAGFVEVGGRVVFSADDGICGRELWVTDGITAGTKLLADLNPGPLGSYPTELVRVGGSVFFSAGSLWRTDGTSTGTVPIPTGTSVEMLRPGKSLLFFRGTYRLWRSDGTAAGTYRLSNAWVDEIGPTIDDVVYYSAEDAAGTELWRSDGTVSGTYRLADIAPGAISSNPSGFAVAGGKVFFVATDGIHGSDLWKTDGTAAGTVMVKDFQYGYAFPYPQRLFGGGDLLYFFANDGVHGNEPWISDGTSAGTVMLKDINPGIADGVPVWYPAPGIGVTVGSSLFFIADDGVHGYEVWHSDGSAAGTTMVADIQPGGRSSFPANLFARGNEAMFIALSPGTGYEVWRSDGTPKGTASTGCPGVNTSFSAGLLGSLVLCSGLGPEGVELWLTDGTPRGTMLLADIARDVASSNPLPRVDLGGRLLLQANQPMAGSLWVCDGTSAGTQPLPIAPRAVLGAVLAGQAFLEVAAPFPQLWRTDGTAAGTLRLRGFSMFSEPVVLGDRAYFMALDGGHGWGLWSTDGTPAGTLLIRSINSKLLTAMDVAMTRLGQALLFTANDGLHGSELWISDGTDAGTTLLADIRLGDASSDPYGLTAAGDKVFFAADDGVHGKELWVTDGTRTSLVKDIDPAGSGVGGFAIAALGSRLIFVANDGVFGSEPWVSDVRLAGTRLLTDVAQGPSGSSIDGFVVTGGLAFFFADDKVHGRELWVSDGTSAGTKLTRDIVPGPDSIFARTPHPVAAGSGPLVVFAARDLEHGTEVWVSDGTMAGTHLAADLVMGPGPSSPSDFLRAGSTLFFAATDPLHGTELWKLPLRALGAALAAPFDTGCAGTLRRVPDIAARGLPTLGNASFGITLGDARPSSAAALLLGATRQDLPLGGCRVYAGTPWLAVPVRTDARGAAALTLPVRKDTALLGSEAFAQWIVADPHGAALGLGALSEGLQVLIGL